MSWSEIKKKKEEEEKKNKSSKTSNSNVSKVANTITGSLWKNIGQNIITSQRNAEIRKQKEQEEKSKNSYTQNMPSTYKRTIQPSVAQTMSRDNNVSIVKQSDLKNQKLEKVQEVSTWGNIVNFIKNTGRAIDNLKNGAIKYTVGAGQSITKNSGQIQNFAFNTSKTVAEKLFGKSQFSETPLDPMYVVDKQQEKINEDRKQTLESMGKIRNKYNEKIEGNIQKAQLTGDSVGKFFTEITPSIGQQVPGYLLNLIAPGSSLFYFQASSEADYYDDAKARGMTDAQADLYAKGMSLVEAGTEQFTLGNVQKVGKVTKGALSATKNKGLKEGLKAGLSIAKKGVEEEAIHTMKDAFKQLGLTGLENAVQEGITEPIQELTAMAVAGKDKANWDGIWERIWDSSFKGAVTGTIMGGAEMGYSSCQVVADKIRNGIKPTQQEVSSAVKEYCEGENVDFAKVLTDDISNKVQEIKQVKTEVQQQKDGVSKDINQETKMAQNGTSQVSDTTETLRQEARNKLESIKQNYDENSYNQMQEFIETAPSEKALNQVITDLNAEAKKQVAPLKQKQEAQFPMQQQETQNKSFEDVAFEAMSNYEDNTVKSPIQDRNINTIGKETNKNAYQYDNPKVKPYFQDMAQQMREDLAYISSPENRSTKKGGGTQLSTTTKAIDILHNEQGYSYDQIAQGLQNIIDDNGKENNAVSKKLELLIDEQLREGYTNALGKNIAPNQEYINNITEQNTVKPKDTNEVMKAVQNYIKNNDLDMTADEFVDWASNIELENEENMTEQQKELYSLISDIQNRTNMQDNSEASNNKKYETVRLDNGKEYQRKEIRAFKDNDGHEFRLYELPNHHNELSIKETGKNQSKTLRGSRNEILKEIQKYWKGQGTFSDIANNQEMLYNNSNESESDVNENSRRTQQDDKRRVQKLLEKYTRGEDTTGTGEKNIFGEQKREYNVTQNEVKTELIEYAKKYPKKQLNENEKKLKSIINKLNGDVIFYEFGNDNINQGLCDTNVFYIDTLGEEKIENVFYHEITHFLRQNNNTVYTKEIQPIVNEIATNFDNQEYIYKYAISNKDFDINKLNGTRQFELAEEVVADNVANIYGDLEFDYQLPENIRNQIKNSMDKIFSTSKNSKESSFNLTQDNQGRKLSKQQQEYFKNEAPIGLDNKGNLKVFYHKTGSNFNIIDFNKNAQGVFWFTDSKQALESGEISANGVKPGQQAEIKEFYVKMENPAGWEEYDKYTIEQLKEKGYDSVAFEDDGAIIGFVFNNSNQIKNVDNLNPTDNPDMRYELEDYSDNTAENEIQRKINRSMTMEQAKDMVQRAFVTGNIYDWYDGKYKNGDEWLRGEGVEDVAMWIDNDYNLQSKYVNSNEDILNEEYTIDDVIEAYQNGTLTGSSDNQTQRLDTSKDTGFKDERFYAPKDIVGGKELYNLANQRVTNNNRNEVYKSRADFIINAHNEGYIESLGLSQKEVNEALRKWSAYPLKARNMSGYINQGVAKENRWTGIENCSIVNELSVTQEQLSSMVKEIKGTSDDYQRRYISNTMLALDTHLNYKNLTFDFAPDSTKMRDSVLGDYQPDYDIIRVRRDGQNTVSHEMGHYIDHLIGRELADGYNLGITRLCRTNLDNWENGKTFTQEQKQFAKNFANFLEDIENSSDIGSSYKMSSDEVFARFVARFTEWTRNTATNNRYGYEAKWYDDHFTQPQYVEFAKLLQEYSLLKTTNQASGRSTTLASQRTGKIQDQRIEDIYAELNKKKKQEVKAPLKQTQENAQNTKVKFDNEVMKTNSEIKGNSDTSEKVAKILSEPAKNVKPEQRTWAILKANFIDKGAVFEKISQKTKNRELQSKYDFILSAEARGQKAITNDRYIYSNGKQTLQSKSLTKIMDEVGENTQAFNEYMYHQLNVDRMTLDERFGIENKPVFR